MPQLPQFDVALQCRVHELLPAAAPHCRFDDRQRQLGDSQPLPFDKCRLVSGHAAAAAPRIATANRGEPLAPARELARHLADADTRRALTMDRLNPRAVR